MTTQETCRQRWYKEKEGRMSDLRKLWRAECQDKACEEIDR